MTRFAGWANPETMQLMAMALLHFLWQGVAIAASAFVAMSMMRRASARYLVALAMLALMVASPVITFLVLTQRHDAGVTEESVTGLSTAAQPEVAAISYLTGQSFKSNATHRGRGSSIYLLWFVEAWLLGVMVFSLRPAAGFLLIERMRIKKGAPVKEALRERCLELQRRLGLGRVLQYCESLQLQAPAVVGWFRPMVLLPVSALTGLSAQQLEAVIAHELAHVKRLDSFVNLFQIAAETLLFYHPAVWWLSKRIRAERENCCDDAAISVCGNPVEYARALATMAEWQNAPLLAMAANRSPLAERVARLLGVATLDRGVCSAGLVGGLLCVCVSVLAGNALLGEAQTNRTAAATSTSFLDQEHDQRAAPVVQPGPGEEHGAVIVVRPAKSLPTAPPEEGLMAPEPSPMPASSVIASPSQEKQAHDKKAENNESTGSERKGETSGSYIDGLKAEGLTNLSIDQLIAMKVQSVTPEYIHAIHELGLKPDVNNLVAMKVQGVTPELIQKLRDGGLALDVDLIIAMQVQGVTPEYMRGLHDLGIDTDADKVIAMKVQGITPEYVRAMRQGTDEKLMGGDLVALKVQGITPEYVREMKSLGFQVSGEDLIAMKVQGVTAEYVKGLQSAGLQLDAGDLIGAKIQGITPEFVEKARKHGFQNLSMDKLLALKNSGVLDQ